MKATTPRILAVAGLAAGLGLFASLWLDGNPLWRTGPGERALHAAINATAPTPPPGVTPAAIGDPDPARAVACLNAEVERIARRALAQYQWTYKRYTLRPPGSGEDDPYATEEHPH